MQNPFRYFNSSPEVIRLAVRYRPLGCLPLREIERGKVALRSAMLKAWTSLT
jgi:hypothetical protein